MMEKYQGIAQARQGECEERAAFFDSQLSFFSKTNWITVLIPSLLGVLAGSGLFIESESSWLGIDASTWIGIGTLIAAILTGVHKGLDCDAHQAECRRLVQEYRRLEVRYRTLAEVDSANIIEEIRALDLDLSEVRQSQKTTMTPKE